MKLIFAAGVVFLIVAAPVLASHRKLPSKKEAEAMLHQASEAANLWAPGTPPYHLSATIQLQLGSNKFNGRYDLWWAAPDKYREGFLMPAQGGVIAETDLALGDKFYVLRNTPTLSIPLWETRHALHEVPINIDGRPSLPIYHVDWDEQAKEICIDKPSGVFLYDSCFDSNARSLQQFKTEPSDEFGPPSSLETEGFQAIDFTDFPVGKRFPREVRSNLFDMALVVAIRSLDADPHFDRDTFQPPPRSKAVDWCPSPVQGSEPSGTLSIPGVQSKAPGKYVAYYVNVAPDGRTADVAPVRSGGQSFDSEMEHWIRGNRYATLSCHGQRIGWEGIIMAPESITR